LKTSSAPARPQGVGSPLLLYARTVSRHTPGQFTVDAHVDRMRARSQWRYRACFLRAFAQRTPWLPRNTVAPMPRNTRASSHCRPRKRRCRGAAGNGSNRSVPFDCGKYGHSDAGSRPLSSSNVAFVAGLARISHRRVYTPRNRAESGYQDVGVGMGRGAACA